MSNRNTNVADIYPLAPMQQGILFESLYAPESTAYVEQQCLTIEGPLNPEAFQEAWKKLLAKHSILRTLFLWEKRDTPLQVVRQHVDLPWDVQDWSLLSGEEQHQKLEIFLNVDRSETFMLNRTPLMRFTLIKRAETHFQLVWSWHHILFDGWSLPLLLEDVFQLYQGEISGEPVLQLESHPYRNYITWLKRNPSSQGEAFWKRSLQGFTAPTPLMMDQRPEAGHETVQQARHTIHIDEATTLRFNDFAKKHRLTLNTIFQGAWAILLSRYCRESEVLFGVTVSGRPTDLPGVESMVGLFINTLPARFKISHESLVVQWLQQVQNEHMEREQYGHCALSDIQKWSDVPQGTRLFESLYAFENYPLEEATEDPEGIRLTDLQIFEQTNHPLYLTVCPDQTGQLSVQLGYDEQRFNPETIERMAGHYQQLLVGIVANPQQRIADLEMLTEPESHQLLVEWNQTQSAYPQEQCIHQLFERQVVQTPDAIAVAHGKQVLSYLELNEKANQLASYLRSLGVKPEILIGICVERSLDMMVGVLGILKAGGAYLPLDPNYPPERQAFMLEDSAVPILLTQHHLKAQIPPFDGHLFCLDSDWATIAEHPSSNVSFPIQSEQLAYVIYTSGSTGKPKGVLIEHRSVINLLTFHQKNFAVTPQDRSTLLSRFAFDACVWEMWPLLTCGASLHILADEKVIISPPDLQAWLIDQEITITFITTVLAEPLLTLDWNRPTALRYLLTGGDKMHHYPPETLPFIVVNEYGPTENTVISTLIPLVDQPPMDMAPPIGRPLPNTQSYILDEFFNPVPLGVPGELYLGGDNLARGYLNRSELTAEKFIHNPFGAGRLYKTGDLCRYLCDGNIDFVGRLDHQIKLRGFRVELGEIEMVLSQHAAVQDVVVLAREDTPGQKRLVAYVIGVPAQLASLKKFLIEKLPDYMVPTAFVFLDQWPLTPNDKLDRRALPRPNALVGGGADDTPVGEMEQMLALIWGEVLKVDAVGRNDNFFELGGDSIVSIQVVSRAKQAGIQISPKDIFQHGTIQQLVVRATENSTSDASQDLVTGKVPLTPIQQWFFERCQVEPQHFNQSMCFVLPPQVDLPLLNQALSHLLQHHDMLRAKFHWNKKGWQQTLLASISTPISVARLDLSDLGEDEQILRITQEATFRQTRMNLSSAPLMELVYFERGLGRTGRLLWIVHHLVIDGISWRILEEDLNTVYGQLKNQQGVALPFKTAAFATFAHRLHEIANSDSFQAEQKHWETLAQVAVSPLPVDFESERSNHTVASEQQHLCCLDSVQTKALLTEAPACYHTQINDLLLTALALTFQQWTGKDTLLLDLEGHGREGDLDLSRTVGWFTSIFPVALQRNPKGLGEQIKSIKEQMRSIPRKGQGYGMGCYLSKSQTLARLPQAEVSFNYLGQFDNLQKSGDAKKDTLILGIEEMDLGHEHSPKQLRSHLLTVNSWVSKGTLKFAWNYSSNFHSLESIEKLAQRLIESLKSILDHCVSEENGAFTPSDFPELKVSQERLDRLVDEIGLQQSQDSGRSEIESISIPTPSQQGMLLESLAGRMEGIHVEQLALQLHGPLKLDALERAWHQVIARHSIFRTGFCWLNGTQPLQYTLKAIQPPIHQENWVGVGDSQAEQLESFLQADRQRGFSVGCAPLIRFALFQTQPQTHLLVLSEHHILMDGWSLSILLHELFSIYTMESQNALIQLEATRPFRDYSLWLQQQAWDKAQRFWKMQLMGFTESLQLKTLASVGHTDNFYAQIHQELSVESTQALQGLVQQNRVTMSTLVQGAWGLLLGCYSGKNDVVFGATVSGRPSDLLHAQNMIGMFINTLPVRLKLDSNEPLWSWLEAIQSSKQEQQDYEYCSAGQIHQWSEVPGTTPLFDSILVFENYPYDAENSSVGSLEVETIRSVGAQTNYGLSLLIHPEEALKFDMVYDNARFEDKHVSQMLKHLIQILQYIGVGASCTLSQVQMQVSEEEKPPFIEEPLQSRRAHDAVQIEPQDAMEQKLTEIWQDVFGHAVSAEESFFELGGHSLLAIQIMSQIEQHFQRNLPVTLLFKYPSIQTLAAVLRSQTAFSTDLESPVIVMGGQGDQMPLFLSPGGGSDSIYLYQLSRQLAPDQPVYGLRPPGLDGKSPPAQTVEEVAAHHVKVIQSIQPHGPYALLGHSSGGHVAFEIAQQLQHQGEEVALLAILDIMAPLTIYEHMHFEPKDDLQNLIDYAESYQAFTEQKIELHRDSLEKAMPEERMEMLKQALEQVNLLQPNTNLTHIKAAVEVMSKTVEMMANYHPHDCSTVPIVLFRVEQASPTSEELPIPLIEGDGGWKEYGPTEVHTVPGNHFTMVNEPHVAFLGEKLKSVLKRI